MGWCGVVRSMRWRLPIWDDSTGVVFEAGLLPGGITKREHYATTDELVNTVTYSN